LDRSLAPLRNVIPIAEKSAELLTAQAS
jgi:hypothetical protein